MDIPPPPPGNRVERVCVNCRYFEAWPPTQTSFIDKSTGTKTTCATVPSEDGDCCLEPITVERRLGQTACRHFEPKG